MLLLLIDLGDIILKNFAQRSRSYCNCASCLNQYVRVGGAPVVSTLARKSGSWTKCYNSSSIPIYPNPPPPPFNFLSSSSAAAAAVSSAIMLFQRWQLHKALLLSFLSLHLLQVGGCCCNPLKPLQLPPPVRHRLCPPSPCCYFSLTLSWTICDHCSCGKIPPYESQRSTPVRSARRVISDTCPTCTIWNLHLTKQSPFPLLNCSFFRW